MPSPDPPSLTRACERCPALGWVLLPASGCRRPPALLLQTGPGYCTWLGDDQALVGRQQEEFPAHVQVQARQALLPAQLGDNADCLLTAAVILGTTHLPQRILHYPPLLSKKVRLGKEGSFSFNHANTLTPVPPSGMAAPGGTPCDRRRSSPVNPPQHSDLGLWGQHTARCSPALLWSLIASEIRDLFTAKACSRQRTSYQIRFRALHTTY